MSNVHLSRTLGLNQLRIRLATLIIQIKDRDIIVKIKTVTKLENLEVYHTRLGYTYPS